MSSNATEKIAEPTKDEEDEETSATVFRTEGSRFRELDDTHDLQFPGMKRDHWWQLWRPRDAPPPPKRSLEDAEIIPLAYASILSKLTFQWVSPIMVKGYQRPLQATDLWKLDESREGECTNVSYKSLRSAEHLSERFLESLEARQKAAEEWNRQLPSRSPGAVQRLKWSAKAMTRRKLPGSYSAYGKDGSYVERRKTLEQEWRRRSGRKRGSVAWALNDVMTGFWAGGLYKVAGDTAQLMTPLLLKALINFSKEVYAANHSGQPEPNIGRGIGMAIGLFLLTIMQSICQHQFFFRSMATGVLARATLISGVYKKTLHMSVKARAEHPNGKLLTYLSSDISRVDYCAQWFHAAWTAPIQLVITLSKLSGLISRHARIGPSAIVGFSLFAILAPLQTWFMKLSFIVRKKSMKWTDSRSRLLRELLSSMEIIKVFTYEIPFLNRLREFRRKEMVGIRKILIIRAANQALAFSIPGVASVLAFVVYAATHESLDPALIFTSLAFFNLLRQPLMFLPRALSSLTDAQNAIERLTETMDTKHVIDPSLPVAVRVDKATFAWSTPAGDVNSEKLNESFSIRNLELDIERGQIIGIIGPVGSGKSSLLQGLIGEMSISSGSVTFGGKLAYCQQNAWIQNASLRDNITFGQAWDEDRYWEAISDSSLIPDLELLADGDLTEIGEKGINLSGGQKQRVNIARALYFDADIILFDDPLSAVDAHVGKALFENAILPLRAKGKTVLLVTHAVHFLPMVDQIYAMENGEIVGRGTFNELSRGNGSVQRLLAEYGGSAGDPADDSDADTALPLEEVNKPKEVLQSKIAKLTKDHIKRAAGTGKLEGRLMVSEVRKTGSVGWKVYSGYLRAGKARTTLTSTILLAVIMQGAQVMSTVWLTWWQEEHFMLSWSLYQGVYAILGVSQALFTFGMGAAMGIMAYFASQNLHYGALQNVFYSPKSMFDTQPLGRILGVFGKDIDSIDNQLPDSLRMMAMTLVTLIGSVTIITVYFHYFIAVIFFVGIGYW
ncbi:hypothetical protein IAU59_001445 [Kwoniella sp. CBS 9459]